MTILWKNITKAINNQRKLLFLADNTASDPTRDSGERGGAKKVLWGALGRPERSP
jgi:hypothetical protein